MFGPSIDHFARFQFADPADGPRASKTALRDFIARLHSGFAIDGGEVEKPFVADPMGIFSIRFERSFWGSKEYEICVGVMAEGGESHLDWCLQVQLRDPGNKETKLARLETMKQVEWIMHERLLSLGALKLMWFVQEGRGDPGQPTP